MEITLDKKGNSEALIKITLLEEDYQPQVEEKVKAYRRQVNLKGFRPGKVPVGLIKRMYGKDIKIEQINELLARTIPQYIQENNLKVVGEPMPDREAVKNIDWESQSEFEFNYQVGYVNDFTYELSEAVTVPKYVIPVTDEKIDETIEDLRRRFGTSQEAEGKSERNDLLTGELSKVKSTEASDSDAAAPAPDLEEGTESEHEDLTTEATIELDLLSEEQASAFVDAQAGDEIFFNLRDVFPEDEAVAQLLNLPPNDEKTSQIEGEFSFRVDKISRQLPAEINQDLFDQVFGKDAVTDEAAFREKVREAIQDNYQQQSEALLERDVQNHLTQATAIEVPEDFLRKWLLSSENNTLTEEQVDADFPNYIKSLKWTLLSNKIAEDQEIKVDHEEVREMAKEMLLAQFGMAGSDFGDDERFQGIIDSYLQRDNAENYMRTFEQVRNQKLLEEVKKVITIQEKEVTLDEFNQQAKAE
ncbi:MAG: trigger factor [Tunicatimonas sp.]